MDLNTTPKCTALNEAYKRPSPATIEDDEEGWPNRKRARSVLFATAENNIEAGSLISSLLRADTNKFTSVLKDNNNANNIQHSESSSNNNIKIAVERIGSDPNLVGDGSTHHILPIMPKGKHSDLKEISPLSVVELLNGNYKESVSRFEIIDCRYPYEYKGGHIKQAINLHTKRQVHQHFMEFSKPNVFENIPPPVKGGGRHIIIFHCEFSSQRGPDMCRYLRDCDRKANEYPSLNYPEMYVLFGGYKAFFQEFQEFCDPPVYVPMDHQNHISEYKFYKSMSKTDVIVGLGGRQNSKVGKMIRQSSMKKFNLDDQL